MKIETITLILSGISTVIAIIESKKTQKLLHKGIIALTNSKAFKTSYFVTIILLALSGLIFSFLVGILKVLDGSLLQGILIFLMMSAASLYFSYASYRLAQ